MCYWFFFFFRFCVPKLWIEFELQFEIYNQKTCGLMTCGLMTCGLMTCGLMTCGLMTCGMNCVQPWCNPLWLTGLKAPTN